MYFVKFIIILDHGIDVVVNDLTINEFYKTMTINNIISTKKKKCLSYIGCVCLVSAVYNPNLQLQKLSHFVVVFWLK